VERLSGEILQLVKERLSEGKAKGELAEVFGSFAAVTEDTPCYRLFFDAYKEETKEIAKSQKRFELRKKLVERGALRLVSREFFEEVLPWEGDKSRKAFKEWEDRLLRSTPRLLEEVVGQVTQRLKSDAHELGEHFLSKWSGNTLPPAFARLYEAAIMDLPLEPLEPSSKEWVGRIHDQITSETKDRLSILTFLTKLSELSEKRNWSIEEFKSDDPAWSKVRLLPSPAKEKILNDCIGTFTATGITTPSNAAKFESMMAKIGEDSPERIAASLWRLIENRDEVTQVNVARAFAQNHLDRPGGAHWAEIVGALARKFDKNTCRLLTAHLEKGFGRRGDDFDERLQELYATAGLGKPKRTEASRTETTAGGGQSLADRLADAASSLGKIKSKFLEKLMGGSEPTNKN
jgi:hypothetical protein